MTKIFSKNICTPKENRIILELITDDLKYLSVRQLYYDWFFPSGAELANQLIDNVIKLYLKSISQNDLVETIKSWHGNESHNLIKIIELCIEKLGLDFDIKTHKTTLENIHKTYQIRYLDNLEKIGEVRGCLKDINTIDYCYKYFRDLIKISDRGRENTLIGKIVANGGIMWGKDKSVDLGRILLRDNLYFKS